MNMTDRLHATLLSWFGLGFAPIASGTFGTLGGVGLAILFLWFAPASWFLWLCLGTALVLGVYGSATGDWSERHWGRKDPGEFVLDEVVGYLVAVAWVAPFPDSLFGAFFTPGYGAVTHLTLAFFIFRFFDILKPWPCRQLERLPGGLGIVVDDVAAGVWSWLVMAVMYHFFA